MPVSVAPLFSAAVVGAAGIGAAHMRELAAGGCDALLVAGRSSASAAATAGRLSDQLGRPVQAVNGLPDLLERDVDFISICTPTELHVEHCRQLLPTGAFILVEKPFFWVDRASQSAVRKITDELFEAAGGRLAVNHPTGLLADAYAQAAGPLPPLRDFSFRYRTRGRYRGRMIAVDLLPHALSALLTLAEASNSPIDLPVQISRREEDNAWHFEFTAGQTRCRFELEQDSTQPGSTLSFVVNGQQVDREQEAVGNSFRVYLAFSGKRIEVPNPMAASLQRALSAARAGRPISGEAAYVNKIMTFMAALLSD
ncbi:Gfo/Idh/MocA family oxidoreductase [Rhodoplanes sp. Z2-YC6860]|uniref:Gfo/Idh/MocA family oxidoreductase n=1 Tax=Rhodoplanes sp. Z2-YC6860 TaxID=674703 RepID=UPI00078B8CFD|nr:Gfo/Idh/MocA family oxidoreductase [Rhodoplanes sp. Z2-YC6860]AMN39537.1 dehydrogenase [Rhodoplanes sp. Z2-YC6860]